MLERVENILGATSYANTSDVVDARRLFVDLMRTTNSQVELLGKLSGEFISEKKHPDDAARESARRVDSFRRLVEDLATKYNVPNDAAEARLLGLRPELKAWMQGDKFAG